MPIGPIEPDTMEKMKAVLCSGYGPPEVLQIKEVKKPVPKDNEVLIKVRATTVTVADFRIQSFTVPPSFWLPARIALGLRKPKNTILGGWSWPEILKLLERRLKDLKKGILFLQLP